MTYENLKKAANGVMNMEERRGQFSRCYVAGVLNVQHDTSIIFSSIASELELLYNDTISSIIHFHAVYSLSALLDHHAGKHKNVVVEKWVPVKIVARMGQGTFLSVSLVSGINLLSA